MELIYGQYIKIRRLGSGSFADVLLVRHAELGYIRALKVSKGLIDSESDKKYRKFMKECRLLLKIGNGGHPGIVKIYQPQLVQGQAVVEMDYIEGETLHDYVKRLEFLPIDDVWRFISDIVGALAYCHVDVYRYLMDPAKDGLEVDPDDGSKFIVTPEKEKELVERYGVVHNDLHAGNVMRRNLDGAFILLDFGLAVQNKESVNSTFADAGALEYSPPEKLDKQDPTIRSDVYSLGVLLYKVLTGRVPFPLTGKTPSDENKVYLAHKNEEPPAILPLRKAAFEAANPGKKYERDYPEEFDAIVMRCLRKDPLDRYRNAKDVLASLRKAYDAFKEKRRSGAVALLSAELSEAYGQVAKLEAVAKNSESEVSRLKAQLDRAEMQEQDLRRQMERNEGSESALKTQLLEAEKNAEAMKAEVDRVLRSAEEMQSKMMSAEEKSKAFQNALADSGAEIVELRSELQKAIDGADERIRQAQAQAREEARDECDARIRQSEEQMRQADAKVADMQRKCSDLETQLAEAQEASVRALHENRWQAEREKQALQSQLDKSLEENERLRQDSAKTDSVIVSLKSKLEESQAHAAALTRQTDAARKKVEDAGKQAEVARKEAADARKEAEDARKEAAEADRKIQAARNSAVLAEKQAEVARQEARDIKSELAKANERYKDLDKKLRKAEADLAKGGGNGVQDPYDLDAASAWKRKAIIWPVAVFALWAIVYFVFPFGGNSSRGESPIVQPSPIVQTRTVVQNDTVYVTKTETVHDTVTKTVTKRDTIREKVEVPKIVPGETKTVTKTVTQEVVKKDPADAKKISSLEAQVAKLKQDLVTVKAERDGYKAEAKKK